MEKIRIQAIAEFLKQLSVEFKDTGRNDLRICGLDIDIISLKLGMIACLPDGFSLVDNGFGMMIKTPDGKHIKPSEIDKHMEKSNV